MYIVQYVCEMVYKVLTWTSSGICSMNAYKILYMIESLTLVNLANPCLFAKLNLNQYQ